MKKIHCTTSTSEETTFSISICENLGWIEPVFLLLSPNLKENLHLSQEPDSFLRVNHFEIKKVNYIDYEISFFQSYNKPIDVKVLKASYLGKFLEGPDVYSTFDCSYRFKRTYEYLEYCFCFIINNVTYLTSPLAFSVDDY